MTISFGLALAVTVVGLLVFCFAAGKPETIGRIMFSMGLLAVLLRFATEASLQIR